MIQFPYGIADFRRIRRQGRVHVDRTAYGRELEDPGDVLVFLRPRRFGKSLWLHTPANCYDCAALSIPQLTIKRRPRWESPNAS
jgi:hypothetical protein